MKASFLFKQYVWMVDTIQRCKRITLADLNERWLRTELSEGRPLSRTTFNRHRNEVEEIFGIILTTPGPTPKKQCQGCGSTWLAQPGCLLVLSG